MDLKGIISITGMSGLYKVVAQAKNGFIVESLADKKRFPIATTQRISALEDISIYSVDADVPLSDILVKMKEANGSSLPVDNKTDNKGLTAYFKTILPNFDEERVYASDIKKIISWYNILKDQISLTADDKKAEKSLDAEAGTEEKPKAKAAKKEKPEAAAAAKPNQKVKADTARKGESAKVRKKV